MHGWTKDDHVMIACCNDGTRPVIFKIERLDYKVLRLEGMACEKCAQRVKAALEAVPNVERVEVRLEKGWAEVFPKPGIGVLDASLCTAVRQAGYTVTRVD